MLPSKMRWLRSSTFSLVLLVALQGTSCVEFDVTTRFEPDGSGATLLEVALNMAMLELLAGDEFAAEDFDPATAERELIYDMRTRADTVPGVTFDTAYVVDEGSWRRLHARLAFDDPESLADLFWGGVGELDGGAPPGPASGLQIRVVDRTVHVTYTPRDLSALGGGSPSDRIGQMLAMNMMEGSLRFVFPDGSEVSGANPPATIAEDSIAWELGTAELAGTSREDSLYVSAALPGPWSPVRLLLTVSAVLLAAGLLVFALRRSS